jgi:probable phosphoglycerate mutase
MSIVLLIRHATTDYVKNGVLAGLTPGIHLNAEGQRQADDLAKRLAGLSLHAIYSSPVDRAVDTAKAIAICQKLDVAIRERLGEADCGDWTGKPIKELDKTETWKMIQTKPVGVKLGGNGESIDQVQRRMVAEIDELVRRHPDQIIAVVSHADPIKSVLAHYLRMDLNDFQRLALSPASVSALVFDKENVRLVRMNDNGKLELPKPEKKNEKEKEEKTEQTAQGEKSVEVKYVHDLNPVNRITVGTLGDPGKRTFFVQAEQGLTLVSVLAEKQQVSALSKSLNEMLERLGEAKETGEAISKYELLLREPVEPVFRIGQLGLGYDQSNELIVLVAYELPETENPEEVNAVRFWATARQMRALAKHAEEIVSSGRPICVLCGRPIDPEGHFCPRRNGHGAKATLTD